MYSIKKVREIYWCSSGTACQEEITDMILKIFTFNDKNPLYLSIISTFHFCKGQSDQGVTQLVIKPFGIPQSTRIVG